MKMECHLKEVTVRYIVREQPSDKVIYLLLQQIS